jgi:hypothetical protein
VNIDSQKFSHRFIIIKLCILGILLVTLKTNSVSALQLRGSAGIEGSLYFNSAIHVGQSDHSAAVVLRPEFYHKFENRDLFSFLPVNGGLKMYRYGGVKVYHLV